jgi:hypothetical protein
MDMLGNEAQYEGRSSAQCILLTPLHSSDVVIGETFGRPKPNAT